VVVIADEAHRTQYDLVDGLARNLRDALPKASFMGFTGTPIEAEDRDTRAIFGEYIDVYDLTQAVEDHATVKVYYEARNRDGRGGGPGPAQVPVGSGGGHRRRQRPGGPGGR
jgi:type I site-specific restriction-modification system R (restriction) subunit